MRTYLMVCLGAAASAMLLTPLLCRLGRALGLVDLPGARRVNRTPVPRIGGLAVIVSTLLMTGAALMLDNAIGSALRDVHDKLIVLLSGATLMFLVGLADDLCNLRARTKLLAQFAAALAVCAAGVRIDSLSVDGHEVLLGVWAWPLTLLWIMGITNAMNLIDGLDGLAAGIAAMTCVVLAVFSAWTGQVVMAVLMLALLGSLGGFLRHNFNPAKVFLGDGGSLFVGFVLASGSVMCSVKTPTLAALSLTILTLGIPLFDLLFSMLRRLLERRSIFAPDRNHLHHRLLGMGFKHRHAVLVMYLVTAVEAALALTMIGLRDHYAVLVLLGTVLGLLMVFRAAGAMRLRESWHALADSVRMARLVREQKRLFEDAQLRTREARSFEEWWGALCDAADNMDFLWMRLRLGSDSDTARTTYWHRQHRPNRPARTVQASLPGHCPGRMFRIDVAAEVNGHLEDGSRRITLFARLLDENAEQMATQALSGPSLPVETTRA